MRISASVLALSMMAAAPAFAQDPPAAPEAVPGAAPEPTPTAEPIAEPAAPPVVAVAAVPAPEAPRPAPAIAWEALVDTYYMWNFNGDPSTQGPGLRVFDTQANNFTLNYMKIGGGYDAGPVGFRVDFGYGQTGALINGLSASTSSDAGSPLYSSGFVVQQAYATVKLLDGALTIDAGKFVTWAGAEVIESNKNWLYSRSLLFNGITLLHTGVRAAFKANDVVTVQAAVLNGLSPNDPDNNTNKSVGLNMLINPVADTAISLTGYFGKEGPYGNTGDTNILVDAVINQTITPDFALNLNFDYFTAGTDNNWYGLSLMGKLSVNENLYLAGRGEVVKSKNLYYGVDGTLFEGTLMVGVPVARRFELRLEGRGDFSDEEIMYFSKGSVAKKNQFTGLASFLAYTN